MAKIMNTNGIDLSIVIPIHNEENLIAEVIYKMSADLNKLDYNYEIILCENGSTDKTVDIIKNESIRRPAIRLISIPQPNYGKALRIGLSEAIGKYVFCYELDLWTMDFLTQSLGLLDRYDIIVASKLVKGSIDARSSVRKVITILFNLLLKIFVNFRGTETHGLKAMNRQALSIAKATRTEMDLYTTEFMIRAERAQLKIKEVPLFLLEKRPVRIALLKRVPKSLANLLKIIFMVS